MRMVRLVLLFGALLSAIALVLSVIALTTWRDRFRWWGTGPILALVAYVAVVAQRIQRAGAGMSCLRRIERARAGCLRQLWRIAS